MSKFSYKTLFIIFFFLLIGVVILSRFVLPNKKVSAAWWDEMWHYRKAISIDNSDSNITNQYVKITLDTATIISSNKMQNTCNDIRVTDINGNLLNHFIDGNTNYDCNEDDTSIYVLINSIPSSGSTIYIYYGNSSATNVEPKLGSQNNPGISCKNIFEHRNDNEGNKNYFITPSGNLIDTLETECNMTDDSGGWTKVYDGLCTSATSTSRTTGNVLEISSPKLTFNQMRISANNWAYSDIKTTTETATMQLTFSGYYQWLHSQPDTPNPDVKFYSAQDGIQDVTFTSLGVMMMGYGNSWRRILPVFYTQPHDSYMYLGATSGVGISGIEWSGSLYNTTMNNTYPTESGKGLTPRSFQEIKAWVRENEITLLTNQSMGSIQSEELSPAPIAYWKFDEGVGTTAYDSAGNNNGILSGTTLPTWTSEDQCISGKCLSFPGANSNIVVIDNNLLKPSQITISGWVKINQSKNQYIINKGDGSGTGAGYNVYIYSNNRLAFWFYNGAGNLILIDTGVNSIQLNNWYFFEATYDGINSKIYLNGVLKNTSSNTSGFTQKNTNLNINNNSLDGFIDDIKIYPYARTADQIKLDYNSRGSSKGSSANLGIKSSTAPDLKSKLVAYWKFDEGNGTKINNSVNGGVGLSGVFGTGNSAPTWTQGKFNKAISFDGSNDYLTTSNIIGGTTTFTISGWIKLNADQTVRTIFSNQTSNSNSWVVGISDSSTNVLKFYLGSATLYATIPFSNNVWYHFAVTYNNGNPTIYINGKFNNSSTSTIVASGTYLDNAIGCLNRSTKSQFFNGHVDEIKIYNYALTSEEIKQDYNQGSTVQMGSTNQTIGGTTTSLEYCIPGDTSYCANPVAEWKFDEGVGTSIIDISGNNNNIGTLGTGNSSPTWTQGKIGSGLNFNGNDYINHGVTQGYSGNLTINSWIKTNSSSIGTIVSKYGNNTYWTYRVYTDSSGKVNFERGDNVAAWRTTLTSNISVNDNNWHFISVNYDSSNMEIYIDGKLDNSVGENRTADSTNYYNFCIGNDHHYCSPAGAKGFFTGNIDQVKIYNYARTPAQIAYDYNKGAPVGWWKLDECQGNIAYDWSGIGNTGVINIGASGTQNSLGTCQVGTSAAWTNGATGKINSSLSFDGVDDYVQIPNIISGDDTHTISFWIKPMDFDKVSFDMSGDSGYSFIEIGSGNKLYVGYSPTTSAYRTYTYNFILGNWYYITVVKTGAGDNINVYINGILQTSYVGTVGNMNSGSIMYLGKFHNGAYNIKGQLDDVRIYNYALTSEQIKTVYNNGAVNFQ